MRSEESKGMDCIISHAHADFDSLASMAAAKKLYPQAEIALAGSPESGVREFLESSGDWLHVRSSEDVDINQVQRLIIVDTREIRRLGDFRAIVEKPGVEVHVYDHHPTSYRDIVGEVNVVKAAGSTTTLLVEIIREKQIPITPEEAALFCLGIYMDTGSLQFPTTTASDKEIAAWLMKQGVDEKQMKHYLHRSLSPEQHELLHRLISSSRSIFVEGHRIVLAQASFDQYIEDLALLTNRLMELERVAVVFCLVKMGNRIYVVGRSATPALDVGEILSELGGGGHSSAASTVLKGEDLSAVEEQLRKFLDKKISGTSTSGKAAKISKFTHTLQIDDWSTLPDPLLKILKKAGDVASQEKMNVFLVGGFVRDLLLHVENLDVDLVVEGDGIRFAGALAEALQGQIHVFQKFGTAAVYLSDYKIDIATARSEYYARPAALPEVVGTSLKQDLYRRDFTVNAMAVKLNDPDFGKLVDFFGGQRDLQHGVLRVLHNLSFVDDPTRIFRAIRFEQRYHFHMESHTEKLLKQAIQSGEIRNLSMERVREELKLIFSEANPIPAVKRMRQLKMLPLIHPTLKLSEKMLHAMAEIPKALSEFKTFAPDESATPWLIYAIALFSELDETSVNDILRIFKWSNEEKDAFSFLLSDWKQNLQRWNRTQPVAISAVVDFLFPAALEGILFLYAASQSAMMRERIQKFFIEWRKVQPFLSGKDLQDLGLEPGPRYKTLLNKLKALQLDGEIGSRDEALEFLRKERAHG